MSTRNNPHRNNRRSHPRLSSQQAQQPAADAGEDFTQLFQGAAFDPSLYDFAPRAFDPTVQLWADHEPLAYVEGQNLYAAFDDESGSPVNPLGE